MFELALIPLLRGEGHRQTFHRPIKLLKVTVPADMNLARCRIYRCETDPPVVYQLFHRGVRGDDRCESFRCCLNDKKRAYWLVNLNHLPRQSGSQIACVP